MGPDKKAVALILAFGFIILLPTLMKRRERDVLEEFIESRPELLDSLARDLHIKRHGEEAYYRGEGGETLERIKQKAEEYNEALIREHPEIKGHSVTVYHDPIRGEDLAVVDNETDKVVAVFNNDLKFQMSDIWQRDYCQQGEGSRSQSSTATPSLISRQPLFQGKAYRVDIPNWGIPGHATAGDIVRFEQEELGNELDVPAALIKELDKYRYSDVIWATKDKADAEYYLSEGMTEADISEFTLGEGARIIADDEQGGFLVLHGDAKPKATGNPGITERGARYGFLQLNEAEYAEAVGSGRYPEPKRYEELTSYFAEPHEPGWKGISLAEMFPTRYQDLRSRGVPDKLSPSEVKTVIEEKRIPYGRGVEPGTH